MTRLDQDLARRGLARSRSEATDLITQGRVLVEGVAITKPATHVSESSRLEVTTGPRYVGRGGIKLAGALDFFQINVMGLRCLDIGSSTGGFTDCLLQRGAIHVDAVDVGQGQLSERLRLDPRVELHESTDIRTLDPANLGGPFPLVVVDVSFISVCLLAESIAAFTSGMALILVKPQFEVGRPGVGKGLVTSDDHRRQALEQAEACLRTTGLETVGSVDSVLAGEYGNREIFLLVQR